MKKKLFLLCHGIFGIVLISFTSCVDIDLSTISKDVKVNESIVLPIGEGNLNIGDLLTKLNSENIGFNADTINFSSSFSRDYSFNDVNLLTNSVQANNAFPLTSGSINANTSVPITGGNSLLINLGLDPSSTQNRFDSLKISTAKFVFTLSESDIKVLSNNTNILPSDLQITFVFPTTHYPGSSAPITTSISVTQFGQPFNISLSNFILKTNGLTGIPFQIQFKTGSRALSIGTSGQINTGFSINQLDYAVAYGRFEPVCSTSTIIKTSLDILSNLPKGLQFANPKLMISLTTNNGTYLTYNILSVKAYSKDYSLQRIASFNGNPTTTENIDVKPAIPGNFVTKNMRTLDRTYGTTDQLFDTSVQLDTLEYKFSLQTADALNNASPTPSFMIPGLKMTANVQISIPLFFKAGSSYNLNDTIQNISNSFTKLNNAVLGLTVTNDLPLKVSFKMKFLDAAKNVINASINDSTYIINSAVVNSQGLVTAPTNSVINIELTKELATQLQNANSMVYALTIGGQDATKAIQITKNNYFKVKLSAFVKTNITTTIGSNNN